MIECYHIQTKGHDKLLTKIIPENYPIQSPPKAIKNNQSTNGIQTMGTEHLIFQSTNDNKDVPHKPSLKNSRANKLYDYDLTTPIKDHTRAKFKVPNTVPNQELMNMLTNLWLLHMSQILSFMIVLITIGNWYF